jgi:hypothetical protein
VVPPLIVHGPKPALAPAETVTTNIAPAISTATNEAPVRETGTTAVAPPTAAPAVATVAEPAPAKSNPAPVASAIPTTASNSPAQTGETAQSSRTGSSTREAGTDPGGSSNAKLIWIVAGIGAVIFAFWLGWTMGRSSVPFRVSLVSRSSDPDQKR